MLRLCSFSVSGALRVRGGVEGGGDTPGRLHFPPPATRSTALDFFISQTRGRCSHLPPVFTGQGEGQLPGFLWSPKGSNNAPLCGPPLPPGRNLLFFYFFPRTVILFFPCHRWL